MASKDKEIIYVDIDDEITTIIDKVRASEERIVALVLPKRASVFQSIVNMKLLKRTAESAKKHVVLITSEASLMPLAAAVGLHVAATPQSKPAIPIVEEPDVDIGSDEPLHEGTEEAYTADNAGERPIGELARHSGHVALGMNDAEVMSLPDDDEVKPVDGAKPGKVKKNRHLKVPNFNKFRIGLFLAVLAVPALIVLLYVCLVVLPRATIAVKTNTSTVNVDLTATLDASAQSLDTTKMVIPAKVEQQQKTTNDQVNATGQQNNGTAATGTVSMSAGACTGTIPSRVPAGTGVSTNGLTFILQSDTNFSPIIDHGHCYFEAGPTAIDAQTGGTQYNVSGATFTVAGRPELSASGSASGGTDDIVTVVSQADIDGAKQKLASQDTSSIQTALEQALRTDGMYPLPQTFNAGAPVITTSNNVGDQAATVTVTQAITYTMFGVRQSDLDSLIQQNVGTQIDTASQSILDEGLRNATLTVNGSTGTTDQITLQTVATVGPDINAATIKKNAAGKKIGDVKALISNVPGVDSVDVRLSPFWVSTVPTDTSKITVTIGK